MKIVEQELEIHGPIDGEDIILKLETCGRLCYKSEPKSDSPIARRGFVKSLIMRGHHSVLEHVSVTFRVMTNRGVTHELVRHRIASYSQTSTRYCNYSHDKFGNEITVIWPWWLGQKPADGSEINFGHVGRVWLDAMHDAERSYMALINRGVPPEAARGVLPNDLMTEIYVTMNLRELRHFITLRGSKAAHPQIRQVAEMLLRGLQSLIPVVFDDLTVDMS